MSFNKFAIVFVGFPGIGKTTVGAILENVLDNFKYIDQDMCKCNPREYEAQIKHYMTTHNLILGKCHHNKRTVNPIIKLLTDNHFSYKIFNFVPDDITSLKSTLLDRIRFRKSHQSLVMENSDDGEKKIQSILEGFVTSYEVPEHPFIQLDYTLDPFSISRTVITEITDMTSDLDWDFSNFLEKVDNFEQTQNGILDIIPKPLKKRVLYYAISFNDETNNKISNLIKEKMSNIENFVNYKLQESFHATIVYIANGITNETQANVASWSEQNLSKEFEITFSRICFTDKVIAIPINITNGRSCNIVPHLTCGVSNGTKPFESNKMFEQQNFTTIYLDTEEVVIGTLSGF